MQRGLPSLKRGPRWDRWRPQRRWVGWVLLALIVTVAPPALLLGLFATDRALSSGEVLRGVWVADVALSGLGRDEARAALRALDRRLGREPIRVRVADELFRVEPRRAGIELDVTRTVDAALQLGRREAWTHQFRWWLRRWIQPVELLPDVSIEGDLLSALVARWQDIAIADPPYEGGIGFEGGQLVARYPRPGHAIDENAARQQLKLRVAGETQGVVDLAVVQVTPRVARAQVDRAVQRARQLLQGPIHLIRYDSGDSLKLSVNELRAALRARVTERPPAGMRVYFDTEFIDDKLDEVRPTLESPPKDARFRIDASDRITIIPGRPGTLVRAEQVTEALVRAAFSSARIGPLPIVRGAPPELTTEQARALNITGLVSQFRTSFTCCPPRVKNIERIAEMVDGTVVRPGETLSLNELVGRRTPDRGFVPAPTIENGEMVDSVGGGISQFATTFFNAVLHGGYDIIERQPHSYYFSRYPMGHEATLSWPKPDVIFRNDTEAGVLIKTTVARTSVGVMIYGDNGGRRVQTDVSRTQDIVQPPVQQVPNPALPVGRDKLKRRGKIGWSVIATRIVTFPDGSTKKERRKVIYKPRPRVVEVHPCRIPRGEPGYTGRPCPLPDKPPDEPQEGEPLDELEGETNEGPSSLAGSPIDSPID